MTDIHILKYAINGALEIWSREYDRYNANPDNPYTKARFENIDNDYNEIRRRLMAEELKLKQAEREAKYADEI